MPPPPDPVAFVIPGLGREVFWYGIMVTLGTLAAAFVADREAKRRGLNPDHVWNMLIVVMIFGMLGARIYHVLSSPEGSGTNLQSYLRDPVSIVAFWEGGLRGLGIIGAVVGGAIGIVLYVWEQNHRVIRRSLGALGKPRRRRASAPAVPVARPDRMRVAAWLDIAAVALPLGQAIGRWGNYFNQELYGRPTTLPWGVPIDAPYRLAQFAAEPEAARFHPTFLYESLWCLVVFGFLLFVSRKWSDRVLPGDIALLYLVLYPLGRSLIELQRPDAWMAAGVPVAQLIGVIVTALASLAIVVRHRGSGGSPTPEPAA